jgi:hypothetical protein
MSKAFWLSAALGIVALSCTAIPTEAAPIGTTALKGAIGENAEVQKAHWGHRGCWRHRGHWHCRRHVRRWYPRYYYGGYHGGGYPYYRHWGRPGIHIHIGRRGRWW